MEITNFDILRELLAIKKMVKEISTSRKNDLRALEIEAKAKAEGLPLDEYLKHGKGGFW